jgi:hypothetical protein
MGCSVVSSNITIHCGILGLNGSNMGQIKQY